MSEQPLSLTELYNRGKEKYQKIGWARTFPPDSNTQSAVQANRKILDSIFIEPRYFEPVESNPGVTLFGMKLKTPAFCSAISRTPWMTDADLVDIARGLAKAGSMLVLGIGGSEVMQSCIDTGVPVVKMVKPYRNTELIYQQKVHDAEKRGAVAVAVGMDIDHFYGSFRDGRSERADTFAPQQTADIRQAISGTKLPFIIKGVLSVSDAEKAAGIGAACVEVSNHGWSPLDCSVPAVLALPKVVEAVGGRMMVLIDSGFKTGNDVFKALALGAKGVGFASSILLAHAAGGAEGVEQLMNFITLELSRTMAVTGCPTVAAVNRSRIVPMPGLIF
jgi:isopentenyl diphosphate isomerase/L-lactate dehydrogenase-like FMN-dependent dehydrogenase